MNRNRERYVFECRSRPFQTELVGDVKRATDIDFSFLDGNFVEVREPRYLGEESKRRAHQKIRKRRRREIGSAALFGLVTFQANASDSSFEVNILHYARNRAKADFPAVRSCLGAGAELLIL